jgi:hypothetical protein
MVFEKISHILGFDILENGKNHAALFSTYGKPVIIIHGAGIPDSAVYFFALFIITKTTTITTAIRMNAQTIPALKMVSIAPHPDNTTIVKSKAKRIDDSRIRKSLI